jgi:phage N-6-adenine-methyltransferase
LNRTVQKLVWSQSLNGEFSTPQWLFDQLDSEFHFTVDVCASSQNAKCVRYFDSKIDGLKQSWAGETCWCNPPYGRGVGVWLKKAFEESRQPKTTVVTLVFGRTDTAWFHDYVLPYAEVRFLKGRLTFEGCAHSAPFGSMIAIFPKSRKADSQNNSVPSSQLTLISGPRS